MLYVCYPTLSDHHHVFEDQRENVYRQQCCPSDPRDRSAHGEYEEREADEHHGRRCDHSGYRVDGERVDDRDYPQGYQEREDVRADRLRYGQLNVILPYCLDGRHQVGDARTDRAKGQSDEQLGHVENGRERDKRIREKDAACDQHRCSADEYHSRILDDYLCPAGLPYEGQRLRYHLRFMLLLVVRQCLLLLVDVDEIWHEKEEEHKPIAPGEAEIFQGDEGHHDRDDDHEHRVPGYHVPRYPERFYHRRQTHYQAEIDDYRAHAGAYAYLDMVLGYGQQGYDEFREAEEYRDEHEPDGDVRGVQLLRQRHR